MCILKISEVTKIDKDLITYINSKTINNQSISSIIREELGTNVDKKKIENKRKYLSKKLSNAGYKFNKDKKIYELQNDISDNYINQENKIEKDKKIVESTLINVKPKRKYVKKKDKQNDEIIKNNPLFHDLFFLNTLQNIDFIHSEIESEPQKIGVRIHQNIGELFKVIEQRYSYIDYYLLVNNAINSCYRHYDKIKNSNWLMEYSNFVSENPRSEKRKNTSLNSCEMIYNEITFMRSEFPILARAEIINFSLYVYAQCYLKRLEVEEAKTYEVII